ncbi:MAG: hypothetical protein A3B23_03645 [Candidatus Colwellbacteria bacterium RIFCSPLOWO2_01_FULL_48_10]|uniref:Glutamyl-tRNA amidotransferase n=2 Tax=Bacteria candidate phyla TaxID=1783234 RepID=A0A1F5P140_9BACT|nr:MAG: hypothetical protein A2846_01105 [Candidatus Doudnabacteria bacterium RIFCSPHIGHO2_01_FULL_49_9]OGY59774.1 MAG: hypothetical protein A3B23_03645 [Candidatus Colwellbacteria bacterium RIFCSPLOWO2_01_FULL_48_10]
MALKEQLNADIKEAMKAKDADKLSTLRMLVSVLNNEAIEKRAKPVRPESDSDTGSERGILTDEEIIKVLRRENKKRDESVRVYIEGGRPELAEKEKVEMAIISKYLPAEMPAAEVEAVVKRVIAEGNKTIGDVMKKVIAETGGRANGKFVSELVKKLLA